MIRFGTDGIRGRSGEPPITAAVATAIGAAAARLAGVEGPRVAVVYDTRPGGRELARAVCQGVVHAGGRCIGGITLPTSAAAHAAGCGLADTAVAITASHNPVHDNGFKVFGRGGLKLSDAAARGLERDIDDNLGIEPAHVPVFEGACEIEAAYTSALGKAMGDLEPLRGARLAVDLAHGAATPLLGWLRETLPCELTIVGGGEGVINDGVGSTHPGALAAAVVEHGCDAGLAVDGDADRCVLVDERGQVVPGDALAWLLATGLGVKGLAVTVMSNAALEPALPGVHVVRTAVGDRHVAAAMRQHGLPLGAEESGHVLFTDGLAAGDGLLTGVRALTVARRTGGSLSAALSGFSPFPRQLGKIRVASRPPLESISSLQACIAEAEQRLGTGGRVFLRYSGTEPVLRILVEGRDEAVVSTVADQITIAATEALS